VSSTVIESRVSDVQEDRIGQLIADQEQVFLRRQPRSTELIALAREHLAGGATSN
jgi:glutamate-1-semialdehyde 2,1-aminomutase